MKVNVEH